MRRNHVSARFKKMAVAGIMAAVMVGAGFASPAVASDSATRSAQVNAPIQPLGYYGARIIARSALTDEYGLGWKKGSHKQTRVTLRLSQTRMRIYYSFNSYYRGAHKHGYVLVWRKAPGKVVTSVQKNKG
jgi:hypothetical protein